MFRLALVISALTFTAGAAATGRQILSVLQQVQPDYSSTPGPHYIETADIEMLVEATGIPFALRSVVGLPDPVVAALSKWRYRPAGELVLRVSMPIHRPITPAVEAALQPHAWRPNAAEIAEAVRKGDQLRPADATNLEQNIPPAEGLGNPRTTLLVYYAKHPAGDLTVVKRARLRFISWLIEHYPDDEIMGSPFAIVNASGEPLADPEGSEQIDKLWTAAVAADPKNPTVVRNAVMFLRLADPAKASELLRPLRASELKSRLLGEVYAFAALGVSAVSPVTGEAIAASAAMPSKGFNHAVRSALLESTDVAAVISAMGSVEDAGRSLARQKHVPEGYSDFCAQLLNRTKQLYPQTTASCNLSGPTRDEITGPAIVEEPQARARLIKRVQPVYPAEAKQAGITGSELFTAVVDKTGKVEDLEFLSGPLVFYKSARTAVSQWQYAPVVVNGKPVEFTTVITVNYSLGG